MTRRDQSERRALDSSQRLRHAASHPLPLAASRAIRPCDTRRIPREIAAPTLTSGRWWAARGSTPVVDDLAYLRNVTPYIARQRVTSR